MTDKCPRCGKDNPAEIHTCTPLALRLAERVEIIGYLECSEAAAELRRLYMLNAELVKALEKLARLGNGDQYGNSIGNDIAKAALAKAKGESNEGD